MIKKNRRCKECTEAKNFGTCVDAECSNPMPKELLTGKTAIQSFANWLSEIKGKEDFHIVASKTSFIIRRL